MLTHTSEAYHVNASAISVSGVSAGAYMAVQFHVSYSKDVMGVGAVAGGSIPILHSFMSQHSCNTITGPYWCAQDDVEIAQDACMANPSKIDVDVLTAATQQAATVLSIDE